jgi:hypothetical protein
MSKVATTILLNRSIYAIFGEGIVISLQIGADELCRPHRVAHRVSKTRLAAGDRPL